MILILKSEKVSCMIKISLSMSVDVKSQLLILFNYVMHLRITSLSITQSLWGILVYCKKYSIRSIIWLVVHVEFLVMNLKLNLFLVLLEIQNLICQLYSSLFYLLNLKLKSPFNCIGLEVWSNLNANLSVLCFQKIVIMIKYLL